MRKLLLSLGVGLLALTGLTAKADVSGTGHLTASGVYWNGGWTPKDVSIDVDATFQSNFNSISILGLSAMMPQYTNGMNLRVDPEGNITSGSTKTAYSGAYYCDVTDSPNGNNINVSGKIQNTGPNESTLTLSEWGDLAESQGTWFFNWGKWNNTVVVFNFAIPIIPAYVEPEPEPEPITGTAKFTSTIVDWDDNRIPWSGNGATLDGEYLKGTLTVSKIPILYKQQSANNSQMMPLELEVNLTTGDVVGTDQQMYSYPGYSDYDAFYCDNDKKDNGRPYYITGKLYNVGDGTTKLILSDFCEKTKTGTGRLGNGIWSEFTAIFNFEIPELTATEPEPEPEPVEKVGTGSWSATLAHWDEGDIPISGQTVNGKFSGNQLTVSDIQTNDARNTAGNEKFQPLILTVDLATGEARGESVLAFVYPGYAAYNGYYCDNDKISGKPWIITGKFVNTGDGKSKLTLSEWCTKYDNTAGRGGPGVWKDSQVIFDFEIEGLYTEETQEPEPVEKVGTGSWSATLAHWDEGDIPISGQTVNGKFLGNQLTVSDIQTNDARNTAGNEKFEPLILTVDLATGEARGESVLAFVYPGYAAYNGYYCDNDKISGKPWVITGKFVNTGDGKSKLTLSEWCTKYDNTAGRGGPGVWKDSQVIFDFEIEGLYTEETQEPDPDPEVKVNVMTANYYKADGDLRTYENVTGEYDATSKTLTIKNIANKAQYPLVFDVDSKGNIVSKPNQISNYEDGLEMYYSDSEKKDLKVYGTIENGEGIATIKLADWGDYLPDWQMFYSQWFNTVIVIDHTIEFPNDDVDPEPEPEPGETITGIFKGKRANNNSPFEFSDDNPFGYKFALTENRKGSYGDYWKLGWTSSQPDSNKENGQYYYVLPATIDPATKKITINDFDAYYNHIKYDFEDDSKAVHEGLYRATNSSHPGDQMENACIVIASYHKSGMSELNRIERAFYLKGGEFKGDSNGVIPGFTVRYGSNYIDFQDNVEYQWELTFEEIPLGEAEESDYATGTGNFKSLYTQEGGAKDELRTATVNGVFNKGKLRVENLPTSIPDSRSYCFDITFDVDLTEGTATATDQQVYTLFNGSTYVPAYFATYPDMGKTVTGTFVNIGDGKCQLTLPDWCEMFGNATVNGIYWSQTKIVFNFDVTGLKEGTEADDPVVSYVPTVNYMTANVGSENGDSKLYEPVTGEYNEVANTIVLTNVAGKADNCPLTLNIDSEGNVVSKGNEVSSHEYDSEGISIYYSDIEQMNNKVYGTITNQTDGTCVIELNPWGDYIPEFGDFENGKKWYNTYIVLNMSIPGLPNYKEDNEEEPDPGVQTGSVEGVWQFEVDDLYKNQRSTQTWTATLNDGMIKFSGNETYPDFYAKYYSDGTVVIPNEEIFIGVGGSRDFDIYQQAFDNYSAADNSYDKNEVVAKFDSSKGTMTFTTSPRQGIIWYADLNGERVGGYDMLSFVKGTQVSVSETEPSLQINEDEIICNPTEFFADVYVPVHTAGLPMDCKITLTYSLDGDNEKTKEIEAGNTQLAFMGLKQGTEYELTLYAECGELRSETLTYRFRTQGQSSGVDSIIDNSNDVRYFNLQGIEIFNPSAGTICIRVIGNKAERIIVR